MMMTRQTSRARLAERLRALTGRQHAVLTGRGATAIWAALKAFGAADQPVLIPANTCYLVLWAVILSGNRPVLVDIDPNTGMITPETLTACGIDRPAAVIPCHLYGLPAPMQEIVAWAHERGAKVIEDAAQASFNVGAKIGAWGDASVFSFGAGKIIDAGGGGALLCADAALASAVSREIAALPAPDDRVDALERQWLTLYWALHQIESENIQIPQLYPTLFQMFQNITLRKGYKPLSSALLPLLMRRERDSQARITHAARFDALIGDGFATLPRADDAILWRYPLLVPPDVRDDLFDDLQARRLDVTRWYPCLQPMAQALCPHLRQPPTPNADAFCARILNLPLTAPDDPPERMIEALNAYRNEVLA